MDIKESHDITEDVRRHFWEITRLEFIKKLICRMGSAPKTVMDIGCGDCFILKSLAESFPKSEFSGIDTALTEKMINSLNQKSGFPGNIVLERKLDLNRKNKSDLILLLDVLEHIEDETVFLQEMTYNACKNSPHGL